MIEPFCSEYIKSYRSHDREPEVERSKPCLYYKDLGENFLPADDSKTIYNPERDESVIKELHLKNLVSTYQNAYCATVGKKSLVIDPNDLEADQFMVYFNKYYGPKTQAVLRPVETSRRILGYTRFSNYYTSKTEYDETISREGYAYFRRDYDKGKSRLFGKKQEALKKLKETKRVDAIEKLENPQKDTKTGLEKEKGEKKREKVKNEGEENETMGKTTETSKEKICMFCCEKYGDFSYSKNDEGKNEENKIEFEKRDEEKRKDP